MKTKKRIHVCVAVYFLFTKLMALVPVNTYTFVNPCQPLGVISPVPNTYGCFSFSASNGALPNPSSYFSWDFGDGTTIIGKNVLHCYSPSTVSVVYTITLSYNSPILCGPQPTHQTYTLMLNPPAQGLCVHNTASISLAAQSVTVWAGSAIPEIFYSYNYGDNTPTVVSNQHVYANCNNYIIEVKDWDMNFPQNICYSYAAVNMTCPTSTVTSISEKERYGDQIAMFPNPGSENLKIISGKLMNGIKIVTLLGKECFLQGYEGTFEKTISLADFETGTYFVTLIFADGSEKTLRFIKC